MTEDELRATNQTLSAEVHRLRAVARLTLGYLCEHDGCQESGGCSEACLCPPCNAALVLGLRAPPAGVR